MIITGNFEGDRNFTVIAVSPEGVEDVLFDERGPFSGETTYETTAGSAVYLDVDADGPWDLIVEPAS